MPKLYWYWICRHGLSEGARGHCPASTAYDSLGQRAHDLPRQREIFKQDDEFRAAWDALPEAERQPSALTEAFDA